MAARAVEHLLRRSRKPGANTSRVHATNSSPLRKGKLFAILLIHLLKGHWHWLLGSPLEDIGQHPSPAENESDSGRKVKFKKWMKNANLA